MTADVVELVKQVEALTKRVEAEGARCDLIADHLTLALSRIAALERGVTVRARYPDGPLESPVVEVTNNDEVEHLRAVVDEARAESSLATVTRERDAARAEAEQLRARAEGAVWWGTRALEQAAEARALAFTYHGRWMAAEDTANDAMREGLAAVERVASKRLVAERDVRRLEGELVRSRALAAMLREGADGMRPVVEAARACVGEDAFSAPRARLRDALRALDAAEVGPAVEVRDGAVRVSAPTGTTVTGGTRRETHDDD